MANDIEMGNVRGKPTGEAPEETDYRPVNWKRVFLTPKYIPWHIIGIAVLIFTVYITIHHDEVVEKLRPFSEKLRDLPAGWLIPIAILFIISFPPLFGHEIVALLCGVVWGLWIGFAIVAAGTFVGEVGTWFAFLYTLRRKAAKLERTNLNYGALARLTRDGGFWIVLVIRLSAIPSHFSTAVFATCNVNFWYFFVATFLSLPKQIFLVYLGVLLVQQKASNLGKNIMFGAVFVVTVVLGIWIWIKMAKVKKILLEEQAQRRQQNLEDEMRVADKEAEQRRFEISEPQAAWTMPQQMSMPRVPPGEYVVRQSWGLPEPPPGRAF
ncbi:Tlg2-vesicle protein [Paraphaeosphaeria sporulosa]